METIEERVKKSSLHANTEFDYKRLAFKQQYLLDCKVEEEDEDLIFSYDVTGMQPVSKITSDDSLRKAAVLIQIKQLLTLLSSYEFSMDPDNLYCDSNNQIKVKARDIAQGTKETELFLKEYKALTGYLSQSQYSYEDFMQGGESLLIKQPFLEKIYHAETVEEVGELLQQEYERLLTVKKETKVEIKKTTHQALKISAIVLGVLCGITLIYSIYAMFFVIPYNRAIIKADQAFLEKDYVEVIDDLSGYSISKLDKARKYELSYSYINGEDLDSESRTAILSKLSMKETEERMDYWINLGRDDVDEAVNIAIKQSDDALLVIAYNKKLALIKEDTSLTAEEKNTQTQNVEQQLKTIQEKYSEGEESNAYTITDGQTDAGVTPEVTATPAASSGTSLKDSSKDVLNHE